MQYVTLEQLQELAKAPDTVESKSIFDYSEVVSEFETYLKQSKDITKAYSLLKNKYLKQHCPPIRYIAEGSSRAAYACNGGKCLKLAISNAGIALNKQEYKNASNSNWICFTLIYDADKSNYSSILTECCTKMKDADFKKAFGDVGITYVDELMNIFRVCVEKFSCNVAKIIAYNKKKLDIAYDEDDDEEIAEYETAYNFWLNVKSSKKHSMKSLEISLRSIRHMVKMHLR